MTNQDSIRIVSTFFTPLLNARASSGLPSRLASELAAQSQLVVRWGETISEYLGIVTDKDAAVKKLESDLLGRAKSDVQARFDEYFFDQLKEYASVVSIAKDMKIRDWFPISSGSKKSPDYKAVTRDGKECCIEVKTARAPIGILDVVASAYRKVKSENPSDYSFRLVVSHYWDNTVKPDQRDFLVGMVTSLAGTALGVRHDVVMPGDVAVEFTPVEGEGVVMTRGLGPNLEPESNPPGLLNKIEEKAKHASLQLQNCTGSQYLALNIETPDAMIDQDVAQAVVDTVEVNAPGVQTILLLHCHVLNIQ